jgi:DNA-binding transcriptional MerR regulator
MKMRELERRTGVSRQMVQYYLANGLLPEPARPRPNVADYGEEHVRAIEAIRKLQTDGRLKVQEIRAALDGSGAPVRGEAALMPHLDALFALRAGVDTQRVPLQTLLARNRHAKRDAEALQQVGAITLHREHGQTMLTRLDAQIVDRWADMRAAGFTEDEGFDAGIVALHVEAAAALASAEVDVFLSRVRPEHPPERKAAMAEAGSKVMLDLFTLLRVKATVAAFGRIGG